MPNWSKYQSEQEKRKRSEKASRAAHARWDAYHASIPQPNYGELPDPCFTVTATNHISEKYHVFVFHPGRKSGSYNVDMDGVFWKKCGFTEAMVLIRKMCARVPVVNL